MKNILWHEKTLLESLNDTLNDMDKLLQKTIDDAKEKIKKEEEAQKKKTIVAIKEAKDNSK